MALLSPNLAASLLLISVTAPFSAGERTLTALILPKLVAVGVDFITRRRIRCCSLAALRAISESAIVKQVRSLIVQTCLCLY